MAKTTANMSANRFQPFDSDEIGTLAKLNTDTAEIRMMRFRNEGPGDRKFRREGHYWLDLCLTPRPENLRAGYPDQWGPHRFERIGDVFLAPPGHTLRFRDEGGDPQVSLVCEIKAEAVDRWIDGEIEWTDRRLAACLDVPNYHIRSGLSRLALEAGDPGAGGDLLAEAVTLQLSIDLARYCQAVAEGPVSGGLASWRLRVIDERMQNLENPPDLEELARLCNMSVRQLTRGFRTSRGCSIGSYIAQSRVEAAKRLLGGTQSIRSIAFSLGYASPSAFSLAFRRATGATPRQFRQRQTRRVD